MGLKLEVLKAKEGDCLLLHYGKPGKPALTLVDGGPSTVYDDFLKGRLDDLRQELVADGGPLPLELVMVSHIDSDHIAGVLHLLNAIDKAHEARAAEPYAVGRLWHNGFAQLTGADEKTVEATRRARIEAVPEAAAVVASATKGRDTTAVATRLGIPRNEKSKEGPLVLAGAKRELPGGLELTAVGPSAEQVEDLRQVWAEELDLDAEELVPAAVQETVKNLSSMIVVAEHGKRRLLLTGDAVAEDILAGLEAHGFLEKGESAHFDVFKLPHHGDEGNVSKELFERIHADHYVASGNGRFRNPGLETLRMLAESRGDDEYEIWLTYREGKEGLTANLETFEEEQRKAKRKSKVHYPEDGEPSMTIDLGDS